MRFRKSIKIAPGLKINLSKSGVSTTVGGKGLSANIGGQGAYLNTGIPGTGVSNRVKISGSGRKKGLSSEGQKYEDGIDYSYHPPKTTLKNAKAIPGAKIKRNILLLVSMVLFVSMIVFGIKFFIGRAFLFFIGFISTLIWGLSVNGNVYAAEKKYLSEKKD
jgi:hypothetical protein